jgi:hypothetical protein
MNVVRTKSAALAAVGAALAAPALLATAGTAHAAPTPEYNGNGTLGVRYTDAGGGVRAYIWDHANPDGVTETCHYSSNSPRGLMPFTEDFSLNGPGVGTIFIPGTPHGWRWSVDVHCDGTGQLVDYWVTY